MKNYYICQIELNMQNKFSLFFCVYDVYKIALKANPKWINYIHMDNDDNLSNRKSSPERKNNT